MKARARLQSSDSNRSIEAVIVVVLVTMLLGIAIPGYSKLIRASRIAEATIRLDQIIAAASQYAIAHPDIHGDPIWPSSTGPWIEGLTESPAFSYSIIMGSLEHAERHPLRVLAVGRRGGPMSGVRVQMTMDRLGAAPGRPAVEGL